MPNYRPSQNDVQTLLKMRADLAQALKWIANLKVAGANFSNRTDGATITIPAPAPHSNLSTPDPVRYKFVGGHAELNGVYEAKRFTDAPNDDVVADLANDDLGTETADTYDLIVWVLGDIKAGASAFAANDIGFGWEVGIDSATSKPIVIHVAPEAGSSMPAPTAKYQVYTPIDDTLAPIWTSLRMGP